MIALPLVWMLELAAAAGVGAERPPPWEGCAEAPVADSRPDALSLDLNVPAFRLDLYEHGVRTRSYRVAVGTSEYPTPRGEFSISTVVWNPWWIPPPSDWAREEEPMPPGPENPMGRVKLQLLPLVFVHGTPAEESIGSASSHGCIRMRNADAVDLARRIHGAASPDLAAATVDSLLADPQRTQSIPLASAVPIRIRYEVAEIRDDSLLVHPDVYLRVGSVARAAMAVLAENGFQAAVVDEAEVRRLAARAATGSVSAPLDALLQRLQPLLKLPAW